jgi:hypothetical protein
MGTVEEDNTRAVSENVQPSDESRHAWVNHVFAHHPPWAHSGGNSEHKAREVRRDGPRFPPVLLLRAAAALARVARGQHFNWRERGPVIRNLSKQAAAWISLSEEQPALPVAFELPRGFGDFAQAKFQTSNPGEENAQAEHDQRQEKIAALEAAKRNAITASRGLRSSRLTAPSAAYIITIAAANTL